MDMKAEPRLYSWSSFMFRIIKIYNYKSSVQLFKTLSLARCYQQRTKFLFLKVPLIVPCECPEIENWNKLLTTVYLIRTLFDAYSYCLYFQYFILTKTTMLDRVPCCEATASTILTAVLPYSRKLVRQWFVDFDKLCIWWVKYWWIVRLVLAIPIFKKF